MTGAFGDERTEVHCANAERDYGASGRVGYPRLTASRLYQMARERRHRGSQSHFHRLVARERPRPVAEGYLHLKTLPGERTQVDWAHFGTVRIGRADRRLMGFVMVLTAPIVSQIWSFCTTLRDDGVGYGDYLEQLTYLIFLKMADEYARPP